MIQGTEKEIALQKANALLDKRNVELSTAIKLIKQHFTKDVISNQLGEDSDKFFELTKNIPNQ